MGKDDLEVINPQPGSQVSLETLFRRIIEQRKKFFRDILGILVATGIVLLVWPRYYNSSASLLPTQGAGLLGAASGLSQLASLAGVGLGDSNMEQLYPDIIRSESILRKVIYNKYFVDQDSDSMTLVEYWNIRKNSDLKTFEEAFEKLNKELSVSSDSKTGIVTLSISTTSPILSAAIINKIVEELDFFLRVKQTTHAKQQRLWIESRLEEVRGDLKDSEDELKRFREKNRQISDSPQLQLEQARLMREVEINTALYSELKQQYEIIRIDEIKNIPIINILDPARPSDSIYKPKYVLVLVASFILISLFEITRIVVQTSFEPDLRRWRQLLKEIFRKRGA